MTTAFKDNDRVRVTRQVKASTLENDKEISIEVGRAGTVIAVLGNPECPTQYLIEFLERSIDDFVISPVESEFVEAA